MHTNSCSPVFAIPADAKEPGYVAFLWNALVMCIFCVVYFSQVAYSVVRAFSIYVVKLVYRPLPIGEQPSYAVGAVGYFLNTYHRVSVMIYRACFVAQTNSAVRFLFPCKYACLGAIQKKLV